MKKIRFAYYVPMMLLLAAGCSQMEETEPEVVSGSRILKAVLESEPRTRTHLSGPDSQGIYYPYWSDKEEIAVYVDGIRTPDKYTLVDGSGTVSGVFAGTIEGVDKVALYPYSAKTSEGLQGKVINLELPSEQPYREGTFGEGIFPMLAVSSSDELSFRNLCAVLRLSMTGEVAVQSIRFVAHDGWMPVSGKATVRTDFLDEPELVMADDGPNSVTLDCGYVPLDPSRATEFFIGIPPGTYRGGRSPGALPPTSCSSAHRYGRFRLSSASPTGKSIRTTSRIIRFGISRPMARSSTLAALLTGQYYPTPTQTVKA